MVAALEWPTGGGRAAPALPQPPSRLAPALGTGWVASPHSALTLPAASPGLGAVGVGAPQLQLQVCEGQE